MTTSLTRNLKLKIDSSLAADSKYNLERLDLLGGTFLVDSSNLLNIRSQTDILIEPNSPDLEGSGVGGAVAIGSTDQPVGSLNIHADILNIDATLGLLDQASGGTKHLRLQYKSDLDGSADTAADRSISIDVDGGDRNVLLGGDLSLLGGNLELLIPTTASVSVPQSGTLSTISGTETLTNKTIDGNQNNLSNIAYSSLLVTGSITNADISSSAQIAYSKLSLTNSITGADISSSASIPYSKLLLTGGVVNSDISSSAAISGTKVSPNFGSQDISTEGKIKLSNGTRYTGLHTSSLQSSNIELILPKTTPTANQLLRASSINPNQLEWANVAGSGTVSSVDVTAPAGLLSSSGGPITGTGIISLDLDIQAAGTVFAGPTTGADATPSFRQLISTDMPNGTARGTSSIWSIADGSTKTVNHGLGSTAVSVSIIDLTDNAAIGIDSIDILDTNTVVLSASEAPSANWRIVVQVV